VRRNTWWSWTRPPIVPALIAFVLLFSHPARAQQGAAPTDSIQSQTQTPATESQPSTNAVTAQAAHATYVGEAKCVECHEEIMETFEHNPHHGAQVDRNEAGKVVQCESCHGPGSLHSEADGDESDPRFATIRVFKRMSPDAQASVCRSCHTMGEQFHWDQSSHARNDLSCQSCHSMHAAKSQGGKNLLSKARPTELCLSCHEDKRAEIARSAHMPLREGGMDCSSCHNPHGSAAPFMIRKASNNELCTTCHMDKRGPFLWEHPPVREDCVTCHMPHGSNNDKVLASKKPFLCQRCHIATRHPSTLYDRPDLVSNRLFNRSCTNCHSQIHGSNHPSGKTFLR